MTSVLCVRHPPEWLALMIASRSEKKSVYKVLNIDICLTKRNGIATGAYSFIPRSRVKHVLLQMRAFYLTS